MFRDLTYVSPTITNTNMHSSANNAYHPRGRRRAETTIPPRLDKKHRQIKASATSECTITAHKIICHNARRFAAINAAYLKLWFRNHRLRPKSNPRNLSYTTPAIQDLQNNPRVAKPVKIPGDGIKVERQ